MTEGRVRTRARPAGHRLGRGLAACYLVLLGAVALMMLFPFLWMVATSLTSDAQRHVTPSAAHPANPSHPEHYARLSDRLPVRRFMLNSLCVAVVSTPLQLFTSATGRVRVQPAAVPRPRRRVRGLPGDDDDPAAGAHRAAVRRDADPRAGQHVPRRCCCRRSSRLRGVPAPAGDPGVAERAGRGRDSSTAPATVRVFSGALLPLGRPALATFAVFAFMASWNAFLWPLVIAQTEALHDPPGRAVAPAGPVRARPGTSSWPARPCRLCRS